MVTAYIRSLCVCRTERQKDHSEHTSLIFSPHCHSLHQICTHSSNSWTRPPLTPSCPEYITSHTQTHTHRPSDGQQRTTGMKTNSFPTCISEKGQRLTEETTGRWKQRPLKRKTNEAESESFMLQFHFCEVVTCKMTELIQTTVITRDFCRSCDFQNKCNHVTCPTEVTPNQISQSRSNTHMLCNWESNYCCITQSIRHELA